MKQILIVVAWFGLAAAGSMAQEYKKMGPDIFDPRAKGEDLIASALTRATGGQKHVLILFGANWCPWTRRLDHLLTTWTAIEEELRRGFVVVYVDVNTRRDRKRNADVIARYDNPVRLGIPVFVVLDHDGRQLTTRETGSLAAPADDVVAARLLRFLQERAPHLAAGLKSDTSTRP